MWARLRHEQALAESKKAVGIDAFSIIAMWWQAFALVSLDRNDEALDLSRKMLAMEPHFWVGYHTSAVVKWRKGMRDEALQDYERAAALERGPVLLGSLCWFYGRAGRLNQAPQVLGQLEQMGTERYVPPE